MLFSSETEIQKLITKTCNLKPAEKSGIFVVNLEIFFGARTDTVLDRQCMNM